MSTRLGILRFVGYALFAAAIALLVYEAGLRNPDGLQLASKYAGPAGATLTTTEHSLVETLQNLLLAFCALAFAWVALRDRLRRPLAILFMVSFMLCLLRELDFFLDYNVADNFWQVLAGLIGAPAGVYLTRHRHRLIAGWQRSWPSAGLAMLMAGFILLIPFTQILVREELWQLTLGDLYTRTAMLAFEELAELGAYIVIAIGTMEFLYAWSRLPQTREMDRPRRPVRRRKPNRPD
ncbi:MAG: hypothetical protein QNJ73_05995 [Gammaproteobacteria bacterium]|nr:hypothetical protein [Gammaproteobacteria bacterium]